MRRQRACKAQDLCEVAPTVPDARFPLSSQLAEQGPSVSFKAQPDSRLSHSSAPAPVPKLAVCGGTGWAAHPPRTMLDTIPRAPIYQPQTWCAWCISSHRGPSHPPCVTDAQGEGAGGQLWAGMPLEGTRFGMTHATARSEVRELKTGLCRERKGSSYRKYGTSVISHQALARSTAGPSASVHCRRNSPRLKPDCHTALPVAVTLPSPCPQEAPLAPSPTCRRHRGRGKTRSKCYTGWQHSPPRVGCLFLCQ